MPLKGLIEGYRAFCAQYFKEEPALFNELATKGQRPHAVVVACADSRVSPNTLFQTQPGELFVVRNVANLIPPPGAEHGTGTVAAIEFGVRGLEVERVIVLGHSRCGGIKALMQGADETAQTFPYVTRWMSTFEPIRQATVEGKTFSSDEERGRCMERAALIQSFENLQSYPWVAEKVADGTLELHAWYFRLAAGTLETYDPSSGRFNTLVGELETAS